MMILINLGGLLLIGLIVWWFWLYKPEEVLLHSPAHIKLKKGHTAVLTFLRKDAAPCAELVQFPELGISETLPLNTPVEINVPQLDEGEYKLSIR